ncbi:MAG: ComEC/Rec2 family competence protein [Caldilineaceae bacterium]|nr:ComEC/Rec2 family competence protein [Caldilineaceae bacterium]
MTLLYLAIAYIMGVIGGRQLWEAQWLDCSTPVWLWLLPLILLPFTLLLNRLPSRESGAMRWPARAGFVVPRPRPSPALLTAMGLCLCMGALRFASQPLTPCWQPDDLAFYNLPASAAYERDAPKVTIEGYVSSYPLVADTQQRLQVVAHSIETVTGEVHAVTGALVFKTGIRQRYAYGQSVRLRGRLVTPPDFEDFSYREYLARKGVHSLFYNAQIDLLPGELQGHWITRQLYRFRARGEALLNRLLPEPYAALANGMLLGIEAGIPDDLYEQFNLTGTSHTIVISGSNVQIIAALFMALGQRLFGRKRAIWPTLMGIGCYALLVGGDAAVLRAAGMGALFVIATHLGRTSTAIISLAVACWLMMIQNPLTFWDVGFQLSSAATAGLILFSNDVTNLFAKIWPGFSGGHLLADATHGSIAGKAKGLLAGFLQDGLLVTIAANLTTLPLVVYYFGRLSVVSFLTNLIVSPVQGFIMIWGSIAILVGVAGLTWVAWLLLLMPWLSLVWTVFTVRWTAALPYGSVEIMGFNLWMLLGIYALLMIVYGRQQIWGGLRRGLEQGARQLGVMLAGPVTAGALCVAGLVVWGGVLSQPDGRLHVYFLDIGQGDGIFIETPSGRQVLIDGGSSPQALFSELGAVMPFWDRTIDLLVLTHPDGDHMNAQIEVPQRFAVERALDTITSQQNLDAEPWRTAMQAASTEVVLQHTGGWLDLGDGASLWVLWPPPNGFEAEDIDNENSLVLKLVYGNFSVLLTGDAGLPSEAGMVAQGLPLAATVLKVGHHGSTTSTGADFLQAVNPVAAVIQVGVDNRYGHPTDEVLQALAGRLLLRNDRQGRIHVWSDGSQMWVDAERGTVNLTEFIR